MQLCVTILLENLNRCVEMGLMTNRREPKAETLRGLIRTFVRRFGLLDQSRTPCGLPMTVSDAHALVELVHNPGIEPLELSRQLGLSKSAVSRLILRLKKRGQIRQERNKDDGRAYGLYLTEKGKRTAKMIDQESLLMFEKILSGMPEREAKQLLNSLPLLIQAISESHRTPGAK
jgi:DNA-binding MarR family transcriptional regulator